MKNKIWALVMTALLTAIATVVFVLTSINIPIAGVAAIRVSFSGPFVRLVAVLFGPVFGGISTGLLDVLGWLLKPTGSFNPFITLTAILNGVIGGLVWMGVRKASRRSMTISYLVVMAVFLLTGVGVWIASYYPGSPMGELVELFGPKLPLVYMGFVIAAALGLMLLLLAYLIGKFSTMPMDQYLRCSVMIAIPGIITSILNSFIIQAFFLPSKGILVVMLPRLAEEMATIPLQAYILTLLIMIYKRSKLSKGHPEL